MYTVYLHRNKINGKVYIGITGIEAQKRWANGRGYKTKGKNQSGYFYNAIKKYGWENFDHEILYSGLTKQQAEEKEIELIRQYQSCNREYGYNIESGGRGPSRMPDETRQKIKLAWMRNKEERCQKISIGKKGVCFSDEHKRHLSEALKGRPAHNLRPVSQYDLDMNFIKRWESLEAVQRELGICKANICRAIKYDRTAGGYKWTY